MNNKLPWKKGLPLFPIENPTAPGLSPPRRPPSSAMAEEITNIVSKLTIDVKEDAVLDLEELNPNTDDNKLSLVLIGRLITER